MHACSICIVRETKKKFYYQNAQDYKTFFSASTRSLKNISNRKFIEVTIIPDSLSITYLFSCSTICRYIPKHKKKIEILTRIK